MNLTNALSPSLPPHPPFRPLPKMYLDKHDVPDLEHVRVVHVHEVRGWRRTIRLVGSLCAYRCAPQCGRSATPCTGRKGQCRPAHARARLRYTPRDPHVTSAAYHVVSGPGFRRVSRGWGVRVWGIESEVPRVGLGSKIKGWEERRYHLPEVVLHVPLQHPVLGQ
eukprot:586625-Rhodomonas_salina.1